MAALSHGRPQAEPRPGRVVTAVDVTSSRGRRVYMVAWGVAEQFGGMTAVCLQRARMFHDHAGEHVPVLTFDPRPTYARVLAALERSGHGFDDLEILNIYHYYRAASLDERATVATPDPPVRYGWRRVRTKRYRDEAGRVFSKVSTLRGTDTVVRREYLRRDGTTFLRDETPVDDAGEVASRRLTLHTHDGRVVGTWTRSGDFYRAWLRELSDGEPTALIVDSIFTARLVSQLEEPHIVKLGLLHNSHVSPKSDPYVGPLGRPQRAIVDDPGLWDTVVFLTQGQHDDYVARFGPADNLRVISNARDRLDRPPPFEGRRRATGVMVCHLIPRKNVASAIRVIARAAQEVPDIHLDVYGDGPERANLQELIGELGLEDHVTLHGHVAQAARHFETATFSMLTSRLEGQSLVLMESIGRGCPGVAYDIRYGPGTLIRDGVNGYLVPFGDEAAAADRVVRICRQQDLARSLSQGAWESSDRYGERVILEKWQEAIDDAFRRKPDRLQVRDVAFTTSATTFHGSGTVEVEGELSWRDGPGAPAHDVIEAHLVVRRRASGAPDFVPVEVVTREPNRLTLRIALTQADLAGRVPQDNKQLDLALAVSGRNIMRQLRVDFGQGSEGWLPYATVKGALSVQRRVRGD